MDRTWFWRIFFKVFNVFLLFYNYLPFEKGVALHLNKLESPPFKDVLCQVWLKLAQWFWRRRSFKVFNVFLLFPNNLSFEKSIALHLNKLESSLLRDTLCQVKLKSAWWFWRRRFLKSGQLFTIISPLGRAWPFI